MQNHYHRCRIIFPSPFRQSCIPLACLIAAAHKGAPSLNQRQWPLDLSPERSRLIWNVVVCMTLPQPRSLSSVLFCSCCLVSLCLSSPGAVTLDAGGSRGCSFLWEPWKGGTRLQQRLLGQAGSSAGCWLPFIRGTPQALFV